ncbi:MAG: ThuA domain-containing protein [Phycisphaeraceae bacterium]
MKPQLLLLTGGINHDFDHARRRLTDLLSPSFDVAATTDVKDLGQLSDDHFAAAVIFTCEKLHEPPPPEVSEVFEAVTRFVEGGGGLVLIHSAITSFADRPAWKRLIGAEMAGGTLDQRYMLAWDDAKHPVVAGVEPWEIDDEHYQLTVPRRGQFIGPAPGSWVFASSLWQGQRYVFGYERIVDRGRIIALAAGHRSATLDDVRYGKLIQQAARHAAKE